MTPDPGRRFENLAKDAILLIRRAEERFRAEGLRVHAHHEGITWNPAWGYHTAGGIVWGRIEVGGLPAVTISSPTADSVVKLDPAALHVVLEALEQLHANALEALEAATQTLEPAVLTARQYLDPAEDPDIDPVDVTGLDEDQAAQARQDAVRAALGGVGHIRAGVEWPGPGGAGDGQE
jgi:hypothetical protein